VIVPAMVKRDDPTVLAWIAAQSRKGATVVSICDGALVVGNAGLLKGRWATAHWASESQRVQAFPTTHWVRNTRYVADGNIVSSAGISAAMPTTIALVEAIAGRDRASALAREMQVDDWSARHDSDAFRPHYGNLGAFAVKLAFNPYLHGAQTVGVPLADGVDEITLAVVADAYSRTGRSHAVSVAANNAPVTSRYGLRFLPDVAGAATSVDVLLPTLAGVAGGKVFDTTLAAIEARYGQRTAYAVALDFEYPGYTPGVVIPRPPPPYRVVLLAYEHMNVLDLSGPLQALATATRHCDADAPQRYETIVASADGGLVMTSAGLAIDTVAVDSLHDVAIDTLIAPGGCKGETYSAPRKLIDWVALRAPTVRRLCSVCTGAFLLAEAGQLDGRKVATHWEWAPRLRDSHPSIEVDANSIFVRDGALWTSAGVTAGIDMTLALIEDDFGHQVAIDTARRLVMFIKRSGGQSQFSAPLSAQLRDPGGFGDLHAWIAANLRAHLTVEQLAAHVHMSPRTFARTYTTRMGVTPAKTVESIRLEAACRALQSSELPLKAIADHVGYGDEQSMRRAFQRQFGVGPKVYRDRFSRHEGVAAG
jgi:transcriptional regulator GlxA family with amidase domain